MPRRGGLDADAIARRGYVVADAGGPHPDVSIVSTGSEVRTRSRRRTSSRRPGAPRTWSRCRASNSSTSTADLRVPAGDGAPENALRCRPRSGNRSQTPDDADHAGSRLTLGGGVRSGINGFGHATQDAAPAKTGQVVPFCVPSRTLLYPRVPSGGLPNWLPVFRMRCATIASCWGRLLSLNQ